MPRFKKRKQLPNKVLIAKTVDHVFNLPINKKRKKLTDKQKAYIKNRALGLGKYESAIQAGYASGQVSTVVEKSKDVQETMAQIFNRLGVDDEFLAKKIREGMDAKKLWGTGDNYVEVEDWDARHKYISTAIDLKGLKKPQEIKVQGMEFLAQLMSKSVEELRAIAGDEEIVDGEIVIPPSLTVGTDKKGTPKDNEDGQHE